MSVAVVIPLYRSELTAYEQISLRQCVRKLGGHPMYVVKPQSLDLSAVTAEYPNLQLVSFGDECFAGIAAYNQLLTNEAFYDTFSAYAYILIYQLDAFVFEDALEAWCRKGFDYVGAPFVTRDAFSTSAFSTKKPLLNGGLSLRKVKACRRLVSRYKRVFGQWPGNEDMLFSLTATRLLPFRPLMKLPTVQESLLFSFEQNPDFALLLTDGTLPFGCHAWEKYDLAFWRPYFLREGYTV